MEPLVITVAPPTGNPVLDTAAIRVAIEQANAAYLDARKTDPNAPQVTVQLASGTYIVTADQSNPSAGAVELLSGVALVGAGMGQTTIKLADNFNAKINGIVRTALDNVENVTVANLTIDGNRANNTGEQTGFICGVKEASGEVQSNITLTGVEIKNCTSYGFNPHEITYDVTIKDCISHHNGKDGFVADGVIGGVYENNIAYANDRHGFNIQNASSNIDLVNNTAYGNGLGATGGAGVVVQRGDIQRNGEAEIAWVSDVRIIGGEYYGNTKEGILVKLSEDIIIDGAQVHHNQTQGVRIEGAINTVVKNSTVYNNSQELAGKYDEIQIRLREDYPDGNTADSPATQPLKTYYSTGTQILDNIINPQNARYAIREEPTNDDGGPTGTVISGNTIGATPTNGDDTIAGSAAGEEMRGLAGNDTYIVNDSGDLVVEQPGEGSDRVLTSIHYTLTANVENLTLTGLAAINGYGNELSNILIGNGAANVLKSFDGNDTLDGGGGADAMTGGNGDDTYYVNDANDLINESAADASGTPGGYDRVFSSVSYTLSSQVEALTLMGTANINAVGSNQENTLIGNSGNNVLDGQGGADTMSGGAGSDIYQVNHTGDTVIEEVAAGIDTVISTISYQLGQNIENLTLVDPTVIDGKFATMGTGNELNNTIRGNSAANKLYGQDGNDLLEGELGADSLYGGLGDDAFIMRKGEFGGDTIFDFTGNGSAAGDRFEFIGFSSSATLRLTGTNTWTVTDGAYTESFIVAGGAAIDASDYKFLTESPSPDPTTARTDIFRFYNMERKTHFYTASTEERDHVINTWSQFRYEGNAFDTTATALNGIEVFRFYNTETKSHFYTTSIQERDHVINTWSQFRYEGLAYYAHADDGGGQHEALYRFYNEQTKTHFYTASELERDQVITKYPQFRYEGTAFYVDIA
ncbi:right-handed parallel beta-helix repeat-containing protein [Microvirga sp. KLBC 81]|uniref:right-handed parallel beta-helix repeat-containing protein n=1 Tax=Microvirga sp. KLBC 81 TaxID=1862707 RepID=UPI00140373CE|nr:right-handed parallel beta-helix repeat-containing protein [Microvirga sp. KLBC 81]